MVAVDTHRLVIPKLRTVLALAADIQATMAVYLCSATKGQGLRI